MSGGMGMSPLTHQEVRAAIDNLQIDPTPDEVRLIMAISREYVSWYNKSSNPAQRDPTYKHSEIDQAALSDAIDDAFDRAFDD